MRSEGKWFFIGSDMKTLRLKFFAFLFSPFLVSCDSTEDKVYEIFKCAKVAFYMGEDDKSEIAANKLDAYSEWLEKRTGNNAAWFMMELGQRFNDDLDLNRYGTMTKAKILNDVYESGSCQRLYKP